MPIHGLHAVDIRDPCVRTAKLVIRTAQSNTIRTTCLATCTHINASTVISTCMDRTLLTPTLLAFSYDQDSRHGSSGDSANRPEDTPHCTVPAAAAPGKAKQFIIMECRIFHT